MDTRIGNDLNEATRFLKSGELVAIPTETVYGLAGNALDPSAVLKIFETKKRPQFDPLIVHVSSVNSMQNYIRAIPETALRLAEAFWPGPLTLLLPKKAVIPDLVTSGLDTVAIRIPSHPVALELLTKLDFPLAAPSANLFGRISPTKAVHVKEQLENQIPYILDGGDSSIGLESTIIGFPDGDSTTIYRLGGLSVEEIEQVTGPVAVRPHSSSNPVAPGMLKSHYAPRKPLFFQNDFYPENASYLRFSEYLPDISPSHQLILSKDSDLREAAGNLFSFLRILDSDDSELIVAEPLPEQGLGRAINDRLRRASAKD